MARQWMKFFLDAGIPKESSAEYAVTFETNRMEMDMLSELDKDYLRDMNITALGDIISILRHKKKVLTKTVQKDVLIKTERKSPPAKRRESKSSSGSSSPSSSEEPSAPEKKIKTKKETAPVPVAPPVSSISSRLGPAVGTNSKDETKVSPVSYRLGPAVSVDTSTTRGQSAFSRLGSQQGEPSKSPSKNVYSRLGPEDTESRPQESRISSTSETSPGKTGDSKTKGILKKRGVGDGSNMSRSKSAPNVISLKPQASAGKLKKRISFGKDEIRLMEASPGIKARLGYGRCSSPPPPEIDEIDEPGLQTELRKIAVGKGQFEIRKVMKVVNEKLSKLRDSVTPERKAEPKEAVTVKKETKAGMTIAIRNTEYEKKEESNYKVDKVDLALRAAKLKSNLDQRRESSSSSTTRKRVSASNEREPTSPGKRLVKYETLADGSKIKTYIDYDDPILETVPIKKSRVGGELEKKIAISKDRLAENFTVTRRLSEGGGDVGPGNIRTLAQRADLARSKHQSVSPEKCVRARLDDGYKSDDGLRSSVRDRVGPSPRSASVRDRIGAREVNNGGSSDKNIFSRLGSRL